QEAPRRPRSLDPSAPAALEAICLKALEKAPERRYPRVKDLAQDVQRFLAGEPVSVYPEPLSARLARWRRRHRTAASGIGALLLAAVVGLSIGTVLINRERARAEASFRQAREAVDELFTITAARSPRVCSHSATGKRRWGVRTRPGQGTSRRSRS